MDAAEFDGWQRYFAEEPAGFYRDNLMAAIVASAVTNASPNRRRGHTAKPADFMLRAPEDQRQNETQDAFNALWAMGGRQ